MKIKLILLALVCLVFAGCKKHTVIDDPIKVTVVGDWQVNKSDSVITFTSAGELYLTVDDEDIDEGNYCQDPDNDKVISYSTIEHDGSFRCLPISDRTTIKVIQQEGDLFAQQNILLYKK